MMSCFQAGGGGGGGGGGGSTSCSFENVFMSCLIVNISRFQQVTADCVSFKSLTSICVKDSRTMSKGRISYPWISGDISQLVANDVFFPRISEDRCYSNQTK